MNKNIEPHNNKLQAHGYWENYLTNGGIWYKCFYNNGNEVGYEEFHYYGGNVNKQYYLR